MQEQSENALESASTNYLENLIEENKKQIEELSYQIIGFEAEIENRKFRNLTNDL